MEKVQWKVDGMTCSNCALTINKFLQNSGAQNVAVNPISGDVSFDLQAAQQKTALAEGIQSLGYKVAAADLQLKNTGRTLFRNHLQRFLFCLPFTAILMLHMVGIHIPVLMNPWVQLALTLPVYIVGMSFFGRSAIKSLRNGVPNMSVLIAIGATAAFIYSFIGTVVNNPAFIFYETAATILTLVFLGEYLEDASVNSTQRALKKLVKSQKVMANMIAFDDQHHEQVFPIENNQLRVGDLILIKTGEQVPSDCKVLWGEASVSEALITGESTPVFKTKKDALIGGSLLETGTVKAQVTAVGNDTVLSNIVNLVKQAQGEKPPMQQLADKISAIFVPLVLGIAALTLIVNWMVLHDFIPSLMRSIAVLVIACPCAMGIATPAAIAVGLGRAARNGILFRNAKSLELFKNIRQVVFDKTGTLTTGKFSISKYAFYNLSDEEGKRIVFSLEKYSNHPLAKSILDAWKTNQPIHWKKVEELKGLGVKATDASGEEYMIGSIAIIKAPEKEPEHSVYLTKKGEVIGWIDLEDEIRPESLNVVNYLKRKGIKTILLSGDRYAKSKKLADMLGIEEVIAEQTPEEKLQRIEALTQAMPTVMIGDGINDSPALAKATIGISMSDASQMAMQTASVVLMSNGLKKMPMALGLGRHTYLTIKQNLFWAFLYNIIALPVAAFGLLTPTFGALVMALSDVVLAANSARLFIKKVE